MSEPLDHSGVKLDIEALLRLRHVVRSWPRKDSPANSLPGGLVHKRRGRGLEAAEIRHFVDGDDVRSGIIKLLHVLLGVNHHQVYIDHHVGQ